jgi:hypothetical protein
MTPPQRSRHLRRLQWTTLLLLAVACSGTTSSCGACGGCLAPIPGGFDMTKVEPNAVQLRVSGAGFTYLSGNFNQIITSLFPNGLVFNIPEITGSAAGFNYDVCNPANVPPSGSPFGNPCGSGECKAGVSFNSMTITPQSPNTVVVTASVNIDTNDIDINTDNNPVECLFLSSMHCGATYCSQNGSTPSITADVNFTVDTTFWQLLDFSVTNIGGVTADANALNIYGKNTCGDIYCGLANVGFIKDLLVGFLNPALSGQIQSAVSKFQCEACTSTSDNCPCSTAGSCMGSTASSTCDTTKGECVSSADATHCVPTLLGVQGQISLANGLGSTGILAGLKNATAKPVNLFIGAGGSVSVDTGLNMAMLGGGEAVAFSPCVGDLPAPAQQPPPNINFDSLAASLMPSGTYTGYHVGFGVSQNFIEDMVYSFHRAGAMCLSLDASVSSFLSTGTFEALLPSLALVSGDATHSAPMMVNFRPTKVPTVVIGDGSYDPTKNAPVSPLLTIGLPDTVLDFYVLIDDRFVRIFTLTIDISVPLSLIVEGGCTNNAASGEQLAVALGDLSNFFTNVRTSNVSIIAEDPSVLAQLIPMIIGIAQPALAGAIKPFTIPSISGFLVKIIEPACTMGQPCESGLRGIVPATAPGQFQAMGGFADMRVAGGTCASYAPKTVAKLLESRIPPASEMVATKGHDLPWPTAVVGVSAISDGKPVQYQWRVDGAFWHLWENGPTMTIKDPSFFLQGWHTIEIRSRSAGDADTIEPVPVKIPFLVDWQPPEIYFTQDTEHHLLNVSGWDAVTPPDKIQFAYQLGDGAESEFGPARPVDLLAVEANGGRLVVFARDEAGNVGSRLFRMPVASGPNALGSNALAGAGETSGCGYAGGPALAALGAATAFARRRRRLTD